MKNKFLLTVFAAATAMFAFTSCETKSNVTDVCSDMVKESIHKSVRSLVQVDGQSMTISEYEFPGGVDDNRLVFRTLSFGNGVNKPKQVENLTYEYGEWQEKNTVFSLLVTPSTGEPYTLWYKGNSLVSSDGRAHGGEGTNNTARVEKWEKTLRSFPNTAWEGNFRGEFVVDSIFEDSIRKTFIPPMTIRYDTIKVFKGKMDTINADTTCLCRLVLNRDANTFANTGHYYAKSVRSKYDRATKQVTILHEEEKEFDCTWYFSDLTSDSKFVITIKGTNSNEVEVLNISKYKTDDAGNAQEFLLGGLVYTRPTE